MTRICEFIVKRKYLVLAIMVAITIGCGLLMLKVETTSDMSKFLSKDSSMKQGVDIIEKEFPNLEMENTIRVMFEGLSEKEADSIYSDLEDIKYVSGVDYEADSEDYVKGDYRLFILKTEYDYESPEEKSILSDVEDKYADYKVTIKDDNANSSELPGLAILSAIGILVLIMLLMCASWLEPIMFMLAIGFAVVINLGTNIVLDHVANITFAVAAILQLVLSMDYSIILSNRFRQERQLNPDKNAAMASALAKAFPSICSSSLTTFVGLLCLLFMSFKIGANIGVVLAKGVICSLVCVMTILPIFLLIFDKAITKTAKRPLDVPTGKLAEFSYKFRKPMVAVFILLFLGAFYVHNFTNLTFTLPSEDPIADVFQKNNPIIAVYNNDDEEDVRNIADKLEKDPNVKEVQSYYTTLGKEYTAKKMAGELQEMSDEEAIDEEVLRMIYYVYYDGEVLPLTLTEFANFLNDEVVDDELFEDYIDEGMKADIRSMKKYTNRDTLLTPMTASGLADFFGMSKKDAMQMLVYYYTLNGGAKTSKMTLNQFASYAEEVMNDPAYSGMINSSDVSGLKQLKVFTDAKAISQKRSAAEAASIIGMTESQAQLLYVYSYAQKSSYNPPAITLESFVKFLNSKVVTNPAFSSNMTKDNKAQLKMLGTYTNTKLIKQSMDAASLATMFGMSKEEAEQLLMMSGVEYMSPYDFAETILYVQPDNAQVAQLKSLMDTALSGAKLTTDQMSQILGMKASDLRIMYTYYDYLYGKTSFRMSVREVVDAAYAQNKSEDLKRLKSIMDAAATGKKYSSSEMAAILGMNKSDAKSLYLLYTSEHGDTSSWRMSPAAFITFLNDKVINGKYSNMVDRSQASDLRMAKTMVDAVVNQTRLMPTDLVNMFGSNSADMTVSNMELLYLLYGSKYNYTSWWKMNIDTLFHYIKDDLCNDVRFNDMLTDEFREDIDEYADEIEDGKAKLVGPNYSLMQIVTTLPQESKQTTAFISTLNADFDSFSGDYHLIGNSPMNYEMSQTFDHEMLLITLITALAIFLVVMLTFRSLIIPAILVLLVQCGVYLTISYIGLSGNSIYYLAMLIVQCILMGATIDYAILLTNYYRENRALHDVQQSLKNAYKGSIHTIMTSGLIICICTFILSYTYGDPSVEQICRTIGTGAFFAIALILLVLPGMLSCFDRFIIKKK